MLGESSEDLLHKGMLTPDTETGWIPLLRIFDFSIDFSLVVFLADDPYPARLLRQRVEHLSSEMGWNYRPVVCKPGDAPGDALFKLLDPQIQLTESIVWFEALVLNTHDAGWWSAFARLLNERREVMLRSTIRVLCLVLPSPFKGLVREVAIDLWSIITLMLPLAAKRNPQLESLYQASSALVKPLRLSSAVLPDGSWREITSVIKDLRDQAQESPARYLPELAHLLTHLTIRADREGEIRRGIKLGREAVQIYRRLAIERPEAFRPDLAGTMLNLNTFLIRSKKFKEALSLSKEVVSICRKLDSVHLGRFSNYLVFSLNNYFIVLYSLKMWDSALSSIQESIDISRRLSRKKNEEFLAYLAIGLGFLVVIMDTLGRKDAMFSAKKEIFKICEKIIVSDLDKYSSVLEQILVIIESTTFKS